MYKNKVVNLVLSVCFSILAVFPFAWGSFSAIRNFTNYQTFKWGALSLILVILVAFYGLMHVADKLKVKNWVLISALVLITISLRLLAQNVLDTHPVTDFEDAITKATLFLRGTYPDVRSARFPYWGFYKLTLSQIFVLFGASFNVVKFFNLFLSGLTTTGLYLLAKKSSGSKKFALVCSLIYTLYPADMLYKTLPTGEHIFIMLLPFICLIFVFAMDRFDNKPNSSLILSLVSGLLLGLIDLYRPVAIILLIASVIALIVFKLIMNNEQRALFGKHFWIGIIMIAFLLIGFQSAKLLGFAAIENKTGYAPNTSGYGWTLRIGLDVDQGGIWNRTIYNRMIRLYEMYDEDYAKVNDILVEETKAIISDNRSDLFRFFLQKFNFTWKSDYDFFYWATVRQNEAGPLIVDPQELGHTLLPFTDAYHIFMLLFSTLGAIYCARKKREPITFILALFIIGFSLILLVTEVQQRYRSVLFSTLPIFASYGMIGFHQVLQPLAGKTKKKIIQWVTVRKPGANSKSE